MKNKIRKVILYIETSTAYGRVLLRGIVRYSQLHGPWDFFWETLQPEKTPFHALKKWNADGLIMRDSPPLNSKLIELNLPTIFVSEFTKKIGNFPYLTTNCEAVGKMAAQHLITCGFKHFAYCGWEGLFWSKERGESFENTLSQAGIKTDFYEPPQKKQDRVWLRELGFLVDWLKSLPKPVAIMACSDDRARQVIIACYNAGLKVPDDVAVIGVDNEDLVCELSTPPISSVALATQTAGFQAAALLDRIMQGQEKMKSQAVLIQPTHVSIRRSTDIIEVNDTELSNALKFIRNNSRKPIQVQDVVDHVMVSRRSLEQKFKNEFGSSILSEMKRVRIAHIKTMLLETKLTISEIADAFGYSSVTNLARYFRQETKINPGVYRKKYTPG